MRRIVHPPRVPQPSPQVHRSGNRLPADHELAPSALAQPGARHQYGHERGGHDDQALDMDSSGNPG